MNVPEVALKNITGVLAVLSFIISIGAFYVSLKADSRYEKLYEAQRMSAIHVIPLKFEEYSYDGLKMGRIILQVTNYTGFKATNVNLDTSFEGVWIREWVKAAVEGLSEKEEKGELSEKLKSELQSYRMALAQNSFDINPNENIQHLSQGSINFDRNSPKLILVRCSWTSENGARFDKIFKFDLISTQAYGKESFTIIPKE